jgi:Tol biopolymer transport system component
MSAFSLRGLAEPKRDERRESARFILALPLAACLGCGAADEADTETIESELGRVLAIGASVRVSVSSDGQEGDLESTRPGLSGDGRVVAFVSTATNLVPGDANGVEDIFVHDRMSGDTERVSVSSEGTEGDDLSDRFAPALDDTGRFVAFESLATNLVNADTNANADIFLRDRRRRTTSRVSVGASGNEGDGFSISPAMSGDARFVAFVSSATNFVPGDTNGFVDAFVRDRRLGTTSRVSVATGGAQGNGDVILAPVVSDDGRFVVFASRATNLTPEAAPGLFVRDRRLGVTALVSISAAGVSGNSGGVAGGAALSRDARFVAFDASSTNLVPNDTNGTPDVFVRDRRRGTIERVSVSSAGAQANGSSGLPSISADGRFVAFGSSATNLVPGVTTDAARVYLHDRLTRVTRLVTRTFDGGPPDFAGGQPVLSGDGRVVAMQSLASNLVPDDTNEVTDVFTQRISTASNRRDPRR